MGVRRLPETTWDQPQVSSSDETFDSRIFSEPKTVLLGKKTTIQNQGLHA